MGRGRMVARPTPTYETPFTCEKEPWGARMLLPVKPRHPDVAGIATCRGTPLRSRRLRPPLRLSIVSYNVLADCNSVRVPHCPASVINWNRRREILLREIFSVRADILCLQDADFFHQWWCPQLINAGYDSLFKQRTCASGVFREGVIIAWKRDMFDLFRSGEVELNRLGEDEENRPLATKAAMSDDVALMVLLRPWQDAEYPSGVCVVCTQLHDEQTPLGDQVRSLQARGLTRTVEVFNADFHLPIVMCGTMNCLPSSSTYEILCRGVEAQDPAKPLPAGKPLVTPLSTSSVRIRWSPPPDDSEALSPPIDKYWILWVPGGSRFLAGESISIFESECLVYDLVETETGNVRTVQNPLRSFVVTGLSSGVAYEFRISAVNSLGRGPWGERSEPVRTPFLAGNDPEGKVLLSAASIKLLRERELVETRRRTEERVADPRAYELRKLVKVPGLVDLDFEKRHPFHSVSGLTPRYSDATLHPDLANARTDAGFPIIQAVTDVDSIASISTGGRRRRRGRRVKQGSNASVLTRDRDGERSYDTAGCLLEGLDDEPTAEFSPRGHATTTDGDSAGGWTRDTTLPDHCIPPGEERPTAAGEGKNGELQIYRTLTCGDPCSRLACLDVSGARNTRQTHALGLRSAYMTYWAGGEPAFTMLSDNLSGTVDFIFFSEQSLLPGEILSIPEMGDLVERDVRQTELVPNSGSWEPSEWNGDPAEEGFEGEWSPYLRENPKRTRHRIPNDIFPSNHLMLMANLYYSEPHCPSSWR